MLWVLFEGTKFGSQTVISPEHLQVHKIINFSGHEKQLIKSKIIELYKSGLSTADIAKQIGKAKTTINSVLKRAGIEMRSNVSTPFTKIKKELGKGNIRPPYGFCYFQGKVIPDPREYENLLRIHHLWARGVNPNSIAYQLNSKKIPARTATSWNRNSVVLILKRFESNMIVHQGGQLELR